MMAAGALVMLMIPAICLFNSGASDRYSALIMFRLPFITTAFVGVQVSRTLCQTQTAIDAPSGISGATSWPSLLLLFQTLLHGPGTVGTRERMRSEIPWLDQSALLEQKFLNSHLCFIIACSHHSRKD
jgi:hypothetical protein